MLLALTTSICETGREDCGCVLVAAVAVALARDTAQRLCAGLPPALHIQLDLLLLLLVRVKKR
eukprot:COSAG04_NODE_18061_length_452_cov_0.651558_1_plen_62_part_01